MTGLIEKLCSRRKLIAEVVGTAAVGSVAYLYLQSRPRVSNSGELVFLASLSDTLIPPTDTPGAVAAGVPAAFRNMLEGWASPKTRATLEAALFDLRSHLDRDADGDFASSDRAVRERALDAVDRAAFAAPEGAASYITLKKLVTDLYYNSQAGASVELGYAPVPGAWHPCVPFSEIGRAWST